MKVTEQQNRYPQQNSFSFALPLNAIVLLTLSCISGCNDAGQQERIEAAKLEAQRIAAEQARLEREAQIRRERQARTYARKAGRQIMDAIGGGQDLIVNHQLAYFDPSTGTLEITMEVSFNGAIIRSNNYQVTGVLTVGEDGSSPSFARRAANQNYLETEATMTALGVTMAGVLILNEMSKESTRKSPSSRQMSAGTWEIKELELCNGVGTETIYVAYALNENQARYARGWFALEGTECKVFTGLSEQKEVRMFATSENRTWSGGASHCVNMREAFKIRQSGNACPSGATTKDFFAMKLNQPGNGRMKVVFNEVLDRDLERLVSESRNN
jgi:uncharacterized membrane protein